MSQSWTSVGSKKAYSGNKQQKIKTCAPSIYKEIKIPKGPNIFNVWSHRRIQNKIRRRQGKLFGPILTYCSDMVSHILEYVGGIGNQMYGHQHCFHQIVRNSPFEIDNKMKKRRAMCGKCFSNSFGICIFVTCIGCNTRHKLSDHNYSYHWCNRCWMITLSTLARLRRAIRAPEASDSDDDQFFPDSDYY